MARPSPRSRSRPALLIAVCLPLLWSGAFPAPVASQDAPEWRGGAQKTRLINEVARLLETKYVFPAQAAAFAQILRERQQAGKYEAYVDPGAFAEAVTADLVEITGDAHMRFQAVEASDLKESATSPLHHPLRLSLLARDEHLGFTRLEWLPGHVGYVEWVRVYPLSESKGMMEAALEFLSGAEAVLVDLRKNRGGAGESLPYFCSFFLDGSVQLTSYYSREDDFLKQFWTLPDVDGGPLTEVPLFILVGPETFSAAEMLAYDLKALNRAILVGEPTGGGANSVDLYPVGPDFELYVSTSTAINPVTGGNWEGRGVIPHVRVPSSLAMDTALALAAGSVRERSEARKADVEEAIGRMEAQLARAEALFGAGDAPSAATVLDSLFQETEDAGFMTEFFLDLLSYPYFSEEHGPILLAILNERIRRFPSVEAYEKLGLAYRLLGHPAEALDSYGRALKLDPANRNAAEWILRLRAGG